ncbi:MAG: 6-carboxytetrahydropterin synthase [Planctomycetia bacterium]|nr:6-carboxytetrahydropterin synthase [Planctomycetia bacterium]
MKNTVEKKAVLSFDLPVLAFSALHCVAFYGNDGWTVEPLHGHDFKIRFTIDGPLGQDRTVLDFCSIIDFFQQILPQVNHKLILAKKSPVFIYHAKGKNTEILIRNTQEKKWSFPTEDILFIDRENVSTEELADFLLEIFMQILCESGSISKRHAIYEFALELEEAPGMSAKVKKKFRIA